MDEEVIAPDIAAVSENSETWNSNSSTDSSVIEDNRDGIKPGVFYVKIFSGWLTIPNRFYLNTGRQSTTFFSHSAPQKPDLTSYFGVIEVGKMENTETEFLSYLKNKIQNGDIGNCFGFYQFPFKMINKKIKDRHKFL